MDKEDITSAARAQVRVSGMSYKFQRLREKLRAAIASGELSGKLPGERALARQFHVNAKTLSKALTDLAAEGLLDRSVGRGTYVKGSAPVEAQLGGRWLIIAEEKQFNSPLVRRLMETHKESELVASTQALRPSFVSQFQVAADLTRTPSDGFHRGLLVRGISSILLGAEPGALVVNAVLLDRKFAAFRLARDIFLAGHRRLLVLEEPESKVASEAARLAAARYAPNATVVSGQVGHTPALTDRANSAVLCDGWEMVSELERVAENYPHVGRMSRAAFGQLDGPAPCDGIFVTSEQVAAAANEWIAAVAHRAPAVLWLAGEETKVGTIKVVAEAAENALLAEHRSTLLPA